MKKILLTLTLMFVWGLAIYGQSASATYTAGDIETDRNFTSLPGASACPGTLIVTIPVGATITSVDVAYDMTALASGNAWMNEQRSQLRCISAGGTNEATISNGSGNTAGTYSYTRTGLEIANGVVVGGDIVFELHAGRNFGGTGCGAAHNFVVNNTWTVTVHYDPPPLIGIPFNPNPANDAINIAVSGNLTWSFGLFTETYDLWFGPAGNMEMVVEGANAGTNGLYTYTDLDHSTTYEWQVVGHNADASESGPVWSFKTNATKGLAMIGDGTSTDINLPISYDRNYSYSQTIYLQNEINTEGLIEKIYYYWNGLNDGSNFDEWIVLIGHTIKDRFINDADWVNIGELTEVFDGHVDIPDEEGWVEIILDNPFDYNNTDNLIIAVNQIKNGNGGDGRFLGTEVPGSIRGILWRTFAGPLDPTPPIPAGNKESFEGIANIKLQFEEPIEARAQFIHNSALSGEVDIFFDGEPFQGGVDFRHATPFRDVPAGGPIEVDIAPAGEGISASIFNKVVTFDADETYIVVVAGEPNNPTSPLDLFIFDNGQEAASDPNKVDLLAFHGSIDALTQPISIWETEVVNDEIVPAFSFGEFDGYIELDPDNYILEVRDGATPIAAFSAELAGREGEALVLLAHGTLNPSFGLFIVGPSGGALVPLSPAPFGGPAIPLSGWALYLGILLMGVFVFVRIRKMM